MVGTATVGKPSILRPRKGRIYTPQQFLELESQVGSTYELNDRGQLEKRHMGQESDGIAARIIAALVAFARNRAEVSGGGTGLQIFPDRPSRIPRADVVYISRERQPHVARGHLQVPPELLVEVVSPGDSAEEVDGKVGEYLSAGVLRVWVVYPTTLRVVVYRPDGTATTLAVNDTISGEDAAPGFTAPVASFFPE